MKQRDMLRKLAEIGFGECEWLKICTDEDCKGRAWAKLSTVCEVFGINECLELAEIGANLKKIIKKL